MTRLHVFDGPMCCATGVCGPTVDPRLAQVAADLEWLKTQGVHVERFNLVQEPRAFAENDLVKKALTESGTECLPLILVDGEIIARKENGQTLKPVRLMIRRFQGFLSQGCAVY